MNLPAEMDTRNGLPAGWEAKLGLNGRLYYYSKRSQIVQILPPPAVWRCAHSLPYGWEMAIDYDNINYYINHITQTVTYEDPRTEDDQPILCEQLPPADALLSPQLRVCDITRDPRMGFGFIAGSEKPVIIRSVTPDGPSEGILLPDDQIVKIGSENVMMADRERVVELIREKSDKVVLTVLQPNRSASSSFLNPAKKTFRTMDRPKVRFADDVIVTGQERTEGCSSLLVSPEVLRVELENKQIRSFRFQSETTAGDAVAALCDKLGFKHPHLFSLVLTPPEHSEKQNVKNAKSIFRVSSSTLSDQQSLYSSSPDSVLVAPWDCLAKVVNNPSVRHHNCFFRLEFMPKDFHELARNDPEAFRYLYQQCVNDIVSADAYKNDLSREELVKLAVIQMQELVLTSMPSTPPDKVQKRSSSLSENPIQRNTFQFSGISNKLTLKYIEKEYGLRRFLPPSVMSILQKDNPTSRNLRKSLQQNLKASYSTSFFNQHPTSAIIPTSPILTSGGNADAAILQLRLQYLKILSPRHLFGGRFFSASMQALMESDITILVGHNYGISQMINAKTRMVSVLAEFQHVTGFVVAPCQLESSTTTVRIQFAEKKELVLMMDPQAAHNFAFMVAGYCRVYGNIDMVLTLPMAESTSAPIYFGPHKVKPSHWNYPPARSKEHVASDSALDFTTGNGTPYYFYSDFSEPITPAVLSQETPVLNIPQKNGFHRPTTPPRVLNYSIEEDEAQDELAEKSVELKPDSSSDSNNNNSLSTNSHEAASYEEINSPSLESPVSSLSVEQYSDLSPSNSLKSNNQSEIPTLNGYLVPTPPRQRNKRVVAEVEDLKRGYSEGEGDWMDLMKVLRKTDDSNDENVFVDGAGCLQENSDNLPAPLSPFINDEGRGQMVREIVVPPPPNHPAPKRKESLRKDGDKLTQKSKSNSLDPKTLSGDAAFEIAENAQKASTVNGRTSASNKDPSKHMSSFKPNEEELNVFSLTRNDFGHNMVGSTSGSNTESTQASVVGTPETESLGNLDYVQDPVTRRKLQETEELIEYFRRKREEVVGTPSGDDDATNKNGLRDELGTPIVISDIAAGNKRLRKAEKVSSKNRKSWAASETLVSELTIEDQGRIYMSNPDLTSTFLHKKRNKSLFRRLFGDRKRRSHSMYETSGTPSAYGRRKRRFRLPKLRLRRTFTLSSKKENRKSVIPSSLEETPSKSNRFRFRPFRHNKSSTKSHGVLVISEPCDDVRGVDMLPSGKYTIAGTMFQANGDASETEIITLDSKRPSRESLVDENEKGKDENEPSNADDALGVKRRENSTREAQRPISFSTFQQAVLEGYADLSASKLATVDEDVRSSLPYGMDQSTPCELLQTESSEALQEIVRVREGNIQTNRGENEPESTVSKFLHQDKLLRKPVPVANPVVPAEKARKTVSLPPGVHLSSAAPLATSTPIEGSKKLIKKRPSQKRPAPPPPVMKRIADLDETTDENDSKSDKTAGNAGECPKDDLKNDCDEDTLFKRKGVESPSLVTEILSYLESSDARKAEADTSNVVFVEADVLNEPALPYDEDYALPGVKSADVTEEGQKAVAENEYENVETRRRMMYEMFYDEMVEDHSRLTLEKEGSVSEHDGANDSDDSEGHGQKACSYDVTLSDEISTDDVMEEKNKECESVVLKSYGRFEDGNSSWTNGEEESVTSSTNDSRRVSDVTNQKVDRNSSGIDSNFGNINIQNSRNQAAKRTGSYGTYHNLISPSGYNRGFAGGKRTPSTKKPPLPPKPIFH